MNFKKPIIPITNLETFKVRISQIPPFDVAFKEMALTDYEMLVATIYRLNELIGINQKYIDLTEDTLNWLIEDGLTQEVTNKLIEWLNDGTLENLINETLFNMKLDKTEFEDYKNILNQTLLDLEQDLQTTIDDEISRIDGEINHIKKKINILPISVRHYGAKGDGVTDDTVAIQSAFEENNNIYFPHGTYVIKNTITIENENTIVNGFNSTLLIEQNGLSDTFKVLANATIKNLKFNQNLKGRNSINVYGATVHVENCEFTGYTADYGRYQTDSAILLMYSPNTRIINCKFTNHGYQYYAHENLKLVRSISIQDESDNTIVDGCYFHKVNQGIIITPDNVTIRNNVFDDIKDNDIYAFSNNTYIHNNTFINKWDEGIVLNRGNYFISNNYFENQLGYVINVNGNTESIMINNNQFVNNDETSSTTIISFRSNDFEVNNLTFSGNYLNVQTKPDITHMFNFGKINTLNITNNNMEVEIHSGGYLFRFYRPIYAANISNNIVKNTGEYSGNVFKDPSNITNIINSNNIFNNITQVDYNYNQIQANTTNNHNLLSDKRKIGFINDKPTDARYPLGSIMFNSVPNVNRPMGWVHLGDGSWKEIGWGD